MNLWVSSEPFNPATYRDRAIALHRRLRTPERRQDAPPVTKPVVVVMNEREGLENGAIPFRPRKVADLPAPRCKNEKDAHVLDFYKWQIETLGQPCKAHIMRRARDFGISYSEIVGPSRMLKLIIPRQTVMWELKRLVKPEISYPEMGRLFSGRDHTTCMHAVKKMDAINGWEAK